MLQATEVLNQKFWIISSKFGKVGTVRKTDDQYIFFDQRDGSTTTLESLDSLFKIKEKHTDTGELETIEGLYTGIASPIKVDHDSSLPLFKKTKNANTLFAAGYYIVKFDGMGWQYVTTPKHATLCKYIYKGPYLTEWEMNEDLKRHRRSTSDEASKINNSRNN